MNNKKNNPWNTIIEVKFDECIVKKINDYYNAIHSLHRKSKKEREEKLKNIKLDQESIDYLKQKYFDEEYGIKLIVRGLNTTYSICRKILIDYLHFDIRKGRNVITNKVKQFRSDRVKGELNPWSYIIPNQNSKNTTSLQGYYVNKNNEKIWLRSSWEYIYIKWLEENNIKYLYEKKRFKFSNGESYTPDFIILDENNNIKSIVEIKGNDTERSLRKEKLFRQEYSQYNYVVIHDVSCYCENINKAVKEWKQIRLKQ